MPEALAASDHDFVLTGAAPNPAHPRAGLGGPKRRTARSLRRKGRRIAPYLAAGFFAAAFVATLCNALVWQKGRHPGPLLFSRAAPPGQAQVPKATDAAAVQLPRRVPAAPEIAPQRPSQNAGPARGDAPAGAPDQITIVLQKNAVRPSPPLGFKPAASAPKASAPDKAVVNAQRALVKLGFVIKPDGVMGTATKKAVARYEHDHGLAGDGALTPALVRRLISEAGISAK